MSGLTAGRDCHSAAGMGQPVCSLVLLLLSCGITALFWSLRVGLPALPLPRPPRCLMDRKGPGSRVWKPPVWSKA